ncbi:hypothetical protein R0G64_31165, partial [Pseudomonas otitidis]
QAPGLHRSDVHVAKLKIWTGLLAQCAGIEPHPTFQRRDGVVDDSQLLFGQQLDQIPFGLDSSVALKASGIEWLGEVPEHWEVKPLKRWVRLNAR